MSGIGGIWSSDGPVETINLVRISAALSHRGPDDRGELLLREDRLGLVHQRLITTDPSERGRQPMQSPLTGNAICCDGTIYNAANLRRQLELRGYQFQSASDTEVILYAYDEWGIDCLLRLLGAFALAIWDASEQKLILARDRAGQKPLYYGTSRTSFGFASELTALFAIPNVRRDIDREAFQEYLAYGYCSGDSCIIQNVSKLLPGHYLVVSEDGSCDRYPYWQPPLPTNEPADRDQLIYDLQSLLDLAVRRRLSACVPIGTLLCGTVESSLVAALASQYLELPCFTVSFPNGSNATTAQLVADFIGSELIELQAEELTKESLERLGGFLSEPIADPSLLTALMLNQPVRSETAIALSGIGGNELFGGHPHYAMPGKGASVAGFLSHLGIKTPQQALAEANIFFDQATRKKYWATASENPERRREQAFGEQLTGLQSATRCDFTTYLPDSILAKTDQMSMAVSLEMRSPWLDHRVMEFAFSSVPDSLKSNGKDLKVLPRLLANQLLPPECCEDQQSSYEPPLAELLTGMFRKTIRSILREAPGELFPQQLINDLQNPPEGQDYSRQLLAITIFELWRLEHGVVV